MRIFLSILYLGFLYFFWCGIIPVLFGYSSSYVGPGAFVFGLFFIYPIAKNAEKKGYSWWKHFLIFAFLSTGIPIIGIIKYFQIKKAPNKIVENRE